MNTNGNKSLAEIEERENQILAELEQSAVSGDAQAQFELAKHHACKLDVKKSYQIVNLHPLTEGESDKALYWLHKAAEQGHREAEFMLGVYYICGKQNLGSGFFITKLHHLVKDLHGRCNNKPDEFKSIFSELLNTNANYMPTFLAFVRGLSEYNSEMGFSLLKNSAENGQLDAISWLGHCYSVGIGVAKNNSEVFQWLISGLLNNNSEIQYDFVRDFVVANDGNLNSTSLEFKEIELKVNAITLLKTSAEHGFFDAKIELMCHYLEGRLIQQDFQQAETWLNDARKQGRRRTDYELVRRFMDIIGVSTDLDVRLDWLREALSGRTQQELPESYCLLASWYAQDMDDGKETLEFRWLDDVFEHESPYNGYDNNALSCEASYRLAKYFETFDTQENNEKSLHYLIAAVKENHDKAIEWVKEAYLTFAFRYFKGRNDLEKCYEWAFQWLSEAIKRTVDNFEINFSLAVLYAFGLGVEKDNKLASKYFKVCESCYEVYESQPDLCRAFSEMSGFFLGIQNNSYIDECEAAEFFINYKFLINNKPISILPLLRMHFYVAFGEFEQLSEFAKNIYAYESILSNSASQDLFSNLGMLAYSNAQELESKNRALEEANIALKDKERELEETMAMFAHKFRGPLDVISSNIEHGHQEKLYRQSAQTMRGLLDIFSMIATDSETLVSKIQQDSCGSGRLVTVFERTLDMILLHLLSSSAAAKIQQHYLRYAKDHDLCNAELSDRVWKEEYFELERQLQIEWECSYAQLLADSATLEQRLNWIEQRFFKLEVRGFERSDIQFREYGDTESLLTIVLNEVLVNAFKYYASPTRQPVVLEWLERDHYQILSCQNPSQRNERNKLKGSRKGHVFLSSLARKTASEFSKPKAQDEFVLEFGFMSELLISS